MQQAHRGGGDQWRLFGRLGEHRIAGGQRGGHLAEEYGQREVPGRNAHHRTQRVVRVVAERSARPGRRSSAGNPPPRAPPQTALGSDFPGLAHDQAQQLRAGIPAGPPRATAPPRAPRAPWRTTAAARRAHARRRRPPPRAWIDARSRRGRDDRQDCAARVRSRRRARWRCIEQSAPPDRLTRCCRPRTRWRATAPAAVRWSDRDRPSCGVRCRKYPAAVRSSGAVRPAARCGARACTGSSISSSTGTSGSAMRLTKEVLAPFSSNRRTR